MVNKQLRISIGGNKVTDCFHLVRAHAVDAVDACLFHAYINFHLFCNEMTE